MLIQLTYFDMSITSYFRKGLGLRIGGKIGVIMTYKIGS